MSEPNSSPDQIPEVDPGSESRREFLKKGSLLTGGLVAGQASAQEPPRVLPEEPDSSDTQVASSQDDGGYQLPEKFRDYSRYEPSYGGPPGNPTYLGKMIPGRREPGGRPVPIECPDLEKLPYKMKNGVKEFHLAAQQVSREFLPGYPMDVYGYNGSMPGPTIEAYQGDRIRIVVTNELPEPTTVHWHGLELPIRYDGVPYLTQPVIPPGGEFVYEYDLHQTGTFFYHAHFPMQEAFGAVGFLIVHPQVAFDPVVDRDFGLIFQNFHIKPNQTISNSWAMDWNWHTINGRSGPFTTPLVVRHGERVRVRLMNFSPMQHHPIHLHGHTFWLTGTEGGRIPPTAWIPRNTVLTGVAQANDFEFIAFNPGDWIFHCHMVHHMMNHMVKQVGPRIREDASVDRYLANLETRPVVEADHTRPGFATPGYPQNMMGMEMTDSQMKAIMSRKEVKGMRNNWMKAVHGLMTVLRVLPDDLYEAVMSGRDVPPGASVPGAGPGMKMDMRKNRGD